MATVTGRTLKFEYANAADYLTANNIYVKDVFVGSEVALKSQSKDGYAILNDAAKAVLFPNATAHPVKADSEIACGASVSGKNQYVQLQFAATTVQKTLCEGSAGNVEAVTGLTDSVITSATSATEIRYHMHINNLFIAAAAKYMTLTLYFNQYTFTAHTSGNGVSSATVSNSTPFEGDSVTFTATLADGATWGGWYSDAACTQFVSTAQSYTVTAGADTVLYAYATRAVTGTGLYVKKNGAYEQANAIYQKVGGVWTATDKTAFSTSGKYKVVEVTS